MVSLDEIVPSELQPRKDFPEESLNELAASIREKGVIQPLIVRKRDDGRYELIAGERRWRASRLAGRTEAPVVVRESDDRQTLELMLIENLQREDLNPIEEALGYAELAGKFSLTQEQISTHVGRSRAAVANAVRLLNLAPEVQEKVRDGKLSVGHAKVILGLLTPSEQALAAERLVRDQLTVRQAEEMVSEWGKTPLIKSKTGEHVRRDPHLDAVENQLRERFGTRVNVKYKEGKGAIEIRFFNDDDLNRLLDILGVSTD
jgi:ParB family chromosome partitioning protein